MRKLTKFIAVLLLFVMLVSVISGCTKKENEVSSVNGGLPYVKLKCYIVGNLPPQSDLVLENLNKMLKKKINTELEITELSWGDYKNKYSLVLASGEDIDLIYTSNWCFFLSEAKKGAFKALDGLVEKYAPNAYAEIPDEAWDCVRVNDKICMIPQHYAAMTSRAIAYREDLRKKYNVPEINSFEDLEVYYDAIKANEPNMFPFNANITDMENLALAYMWQKEGMRVTNLGNGFVASVDDPEEKLIPVYESASYKEWAEIAKRWYKKGFWSKDILSNKTASDTAFLNGTSASTAVQLSSGIYLMNKAEESNPGWELGTFMLTHNGKSPINPYNQNGVAIPTTSKNTERVLMVYDLLSTNKEFYDAHVYGIEGVTYKKNEDGTYSYPDNFVQGEGYTFGGIGLRMGMNNPKLNSENLDKARKEYLKYQNDPEAPQKYGLPLSCSMMLFDTDTYTNELTNIQNVYKTYNNLLISGVDTAASVKKQISNFKKESETAGIKKVGKIVNEQKDEFLKSKK